jgi:hypothetical protein
VGVPPTAEIFKAPVDSPTQYIGLTYQAYINIGGSVIVNVFVLDRNFWHLTETTYPCWT